MKLLLRIHILVENCTEPELGRILTSCNYPITNLNSEIDDVTDGFHQSYNYFKKNPKFDDGFFEKYYDQNINYVDISFEGLELNKYLDKIMLLAEELKTKTKHNVFVTEEYDADSVLKVI